MKTQNIIIRDECLYIDKLLNIVLLIFLIINTYIFFSIKNFKIINFDFSELFFHLNIVRSQINKQILNKCLCLPNSNYAIIKAIDNTILLFNENKN